MDICVTKFEKENPTETCKAAVVSQVKSYKYNNLSIGSVTSENNNLKIFIL